MVKGVILVDLTDQGRRVIKESPNRAEAESPPVRLSSKWATVAGTGR